jgi:serine/threonine-protein kinase
MPNGTVAGTVALLFVVSLAVSSIGAQILLGLRRSQFQAAEARRYHIERKLGGGGMGDVYLARHGTLKMPCAIKVCRPAGGLAGDMLRRFEKEARQVSRLKHPNVVRIFDYGEMEDGAVYYAMEHLPGMDLGEFLRREGVPPEERLLHWADQMLFALEEAHAQGIVHRDLKPANVFLTSLGGEPDVIKLLDFGLVKLIEERADGDDRITRANAIPGTPLYMSPEQAQGLDSVDHRSDLYSLGVVLYELLCGRPPFAGSDPMNVLVQHVTVAPRPVREINEAVSAETEAAVLRLLAKAPAERFPDARSTHLALRQSPRHGAWDRERALRWWAALPADGAPAAAPGDPTETMDDDR